MHINMAELDAMVKELNGLEGGESAATDWLCHSLLMDLWQSFGDEQIEDKSSQRNANSTAYWPGDIASWRVQTAVEGVPDTIGK